MALPFPILYEDDSIIAVNKPACFHSVENPRSNSRTSVAKELIDFLPAQRAASEKPVDGGLVHRLDYETSGVIIAAKDREIWGHLRDAISSGASKKSYLLLVEGRFPKTKTVSAKISSRSRAGKKVLVSEEVPKGARWSLDSETEFALHHYIENMNVSIVRAILSRGRRHQVRAHAASIEFPLVGDSLYESKLTLASLFTNEVSPQPGFFLHAESIRFEHPYAKTEVKITAPLPKYPWVESFRELLR